jgi:hypothetical protein
MSVPRTQTVLAAGGLTALLAAASVAVVVTHGSSPSAPVDGTGRIVNVAFSGFTDCGALLDYYRSHGRDLVRPYGLPGTGAVVTNAAGSAAVPGVPAPLRLPRSAVAENAPGSASGAGSGATTGSSDQAGNGTNVQVTGVDEADVAKRSGDLLLTVAAPPGRMAYPRQAPGATGVEPGSVRAGVPVGPGLRILRTSGGRAVLLGVLATTDWTAGELLVRGNTVLLLGTAPYRRVATGSDLPTVAPQRPRTRIVQVDIADPAHPKLQRTLDVDGTLIGARLSGGVARVAVTSQPGDLRLVTPQNVTPQNVTPQNVAPQNVAPQDVTPQTVTPATGAPVPGTPVPPNAAAPSPAPTRNGESDSLAANRKLIAGSTLDQWLPHYTLAEGAADTGSATPGTGARTSSGRLLDCAKVAAPAQFSGLDTLSLLTFDLGRSAGIGSWDGAGVVATGATLYATADHAYLATSPWQDWSAMTDPQRLQKAQQQRTWIHEFATSGSGGPRYVASGSVPGFLPSQYAMDEYRGDLRVASTVRPAWLSGPQPTTPSGPQSGVPSTPTSAPVDSGQVTVLRADGDRLTALASVSGIGHDEQIRGVRFIGPVGYVVTFRQTDPLFTLDLSDPARPRVAGELKLLGYSAYLHPAGDGLLLGVGQSATTDGAREGLQLSLFDVSNPAAPRRVSHVTLPGASSDVESDAHAFTFVDGLVLLPYSRAAYLPGPLSGTGTGAMPMPMPSGGSAASGGSAVMPSYVMMVDAGVIGVRVDGRTLSQPTVMHPRGPSSSAVVPRSYPYGMPFGTSEPLRTFVGGGGIWTVTRDGVALHQESTLRWLSYTTFAR